MAQPSSAVEMRAAGRRGACHTWAAALSSHAPVTEATLSQPVSPRGSRFLLLHWEAVTQPHGCWPLPGSAPPLPSQRGLPDNPQRPSSTHVPDQAAPCSFRETGLCCPRPRSQRGRQWPTLTGAHVHTPGRFTEMQADKLSAPPPLLQRACAGWVARFPLHGRSRPATSITAARTRL